MTCPSRILAEAPVINIISRRLSRRTELLFLPGNKCFEVGCFAQNYKLMKIIILPLRDMVRDNLFIPCFSGIKIRNVNDVELSKNAEQQLGSLPISRAISISDKWRLHASSRVQENNFNLSKSPSSTLGGGSDFTTSNVLDSKRCVRACTGRIILKRIETLVESPLGGKPDFIAFYLFTGARSLDVHSETIRTQLPLCSTT